MVSQDESFSKDQSKNQSKDQSENDINLYRLNKYLAHAGVASRRKADELIKAGHVKVNGEVVREVGVKVTIDDAVEYDGKQLTPGKKVYILVNKPKDVICTTSDERGRRTIMDVIKGAASERVYPVGRLDRPTTGLILLTNDGDLSQKLAHPSGNIKKLYKVQLNKALTQEDFDHIVKGVELEEGKAIVDDIAYAEADKKTIGLELHIGWNRIIRRIFETLEYRVEKLDRVMYAGLTKKDLPRGKWRYLKEREVIQLKHFI